MDTSTTHTAALQPSASEPDRFAQLRSQHGEELRRLEQRHRDDQKRAQERLGQEREETRKRHDEQLVSLRDSLNKALAENSLLRAQLHQVRSDAKEDEAFTALENSIAQAGLLEERNQALKNGQRLAWDLERHRSDAASRINALSEELENARQKAEYFEFEAELANDALHKAHLQLREATRAETKFQDQISALIVERDTLEDQVVAANKDRHRLAAIAHQAGTQAKLELIELLSPAFDVVRYARVYDNLDQIHVLLEEAQARFERARVRAGRDPEQELNATEAAKLLGIAKRVLRTIDAKDLPYETAGSGGHREHRRYRRRDCLGYLAYSRKQGMCRAAAKIHNPRSKST